MATSMDIAGTRHSADEATTCTHLGFLHFVTWIDDNFPTFSSMQCGKQVENGSSPMRFRGSGGAPNRSPTQKSLPVRAERANISSEEVQSFLKRTRVFHTRQRPPTQPQHNGAADRMIRTPVSEPGRCSPTREPPESDTYWWDATQYAALLHKVIPTSALSRTSPLKKPGVVISRTSPDSCTFDSCALVHIPDKTRASSSIRQALPHLPVHRLRQTTQGPSPCSSANGTPHRVLRCCL